MDKQSVMDAKRELFRLLNKQPMNVILYLKNAVETKHFDGSDMFDGYTWEIPCGCVYGTVAIARGAVSAYDAIGFTAANLPDFKGPCFITGWVNRKYSPLERFVIVIKPYSTAKKSQGRSAILLRWINEYLAKRETLLTSQTTPS